MYQIISNGVLVGACDSPRFIKTKGTSFIEATQDEAEGVAICGAPYNLTGHTEITIDNVAEDGTVSRVAAPEAIIRQVDSGEMYFGHGSKIASLETSDTEMQMALCEVYEALGGN